MCWRQTIGQRTKAEALDADPSQVEQASAKGTARGAENERMDFTTFEAIRSESELFGRGQAELD
jgi:hypothetical protein